jgi:hypothetical protein
MQDEEREFIDTFCRAYLLEVVESTKYESYDGLKDFIIHEASYNQVLLAVFEQKTFLTELHESDEDDSDIERARKLQGIEKAVKPVLGLSIAIVAGMERVRGPVAAAIKNLIKGKDNLATRFIGRAQKGEGAAGLVSSTAVNLILLPAITYLVGKMVFVTWEKSKSVCRAKCKQRVDPSDGHKRLRMKVCESQCKVTGYKRLIAKLRSEVSKCKSTENPEKCQTTLVKHLGKYNDMLRTEEERLRRLTAQLNSKASVAKKKDIGAVRPPQIR